MTSENLWNYEDNDNSNEDNDKSKTTGSRPFEYKTKIIGRTSINNNRLDTKVVIPLLFHLSNVWKSIELSLIDYEIELDLTWSKDCIQASIQLLIHQPTMFQQHQQLKQHFR